MKRCGHLFLPGPGLVDGVPAHRGVHDQKGVVWSAGGVQGNNRRQGRNQPHGACALKLKSNLGKKGARAARVMRFRLSRRRESASPWPRTSAVQSERRKKRSKNRGERDEQDTNNERGSTTRPAHMARQPKTKRLPKSTHVTGSTVFSARTGPALGGEANGGKGKSSPPALMFQFDKLHNSRHPFLQQSHMHQTKDKASAKTRSRRREFRTRNYRGRRTDRARVAETKACPAQPHAACLLLRPRQGAVELLLSSTPFRRCVWCPEVVSCSLN